MLAEVNNRLWLVLLEDKMDMNKRLEHVAELRILYWEMPRRPGDRFVEIRRWETADGTTSELIVEMGRLMDDGDLQTRC